MTGDIIAAINLGSQSVRILSEEETTVSIPTVSFNNPEASPFVKEEVTKKSPSNANALLHNGMQNDQLFLEDLTLLF